MKSKFLLLILLAAPSAVLAAQTTEYTTGRQLYSDGQFKLATVHFQAAVRANPDDAESCYWLGATYRTLADVAMPYGRKDETRARFYLTRAVQLAPASVRYRTELFDFLLQSDSAANLHQAVELLRTVSVNDPDYPFLKQRLEDEGKNRRGAQARFVHLFLQSQKAIYNVVTFPASALSPLHSSPRSPGQEPLLDSRASARR